MNSLFLLRQLEMLSVEPKYKEEKQKYFALRLDSNENAVQVEQGSCASDLKTLVLLDEEQPKPTCPCNRGKLIVDATCTPADIRFPTDIYMTTLVLNLDKICTKEMAENKAKYRVLLRNAS